MMGIRYPVMDELFFRATAKMSFKPTFCFVIVLME